MVSQGRPVANFSALYIKEDLDVREGKDNDKAENWMKNNVFVLLTKCYHVT